MKYALRDAFGVVDLIEDSKETFRGDKYNYRGFDSTATGIAHEDSSSRFARLKDGMRYKRGGEAKYWIPKPGEIQEEINQNTPLLDAAGQPSTSTSTSTSRFRYTESNDTDFVIDNVDENLYGKARELEFGDWNVSTSTISNC